MTLKSDMKASSARVQISRHRNRRRVVGIWLRRLRPGADCICFLELRFDRGAPDRRRRREPRTQLVALLFAMPTSMDFRGVQTLTHDDDAPSLRLVRSRRTADEHAPQ